MGLKKAFITLHVSYGTFKPVKVDEVELHRVDGVCNGAKSNHYAYKGNKGEGQKGGSCGHHGGKGIGDCRL